MTWQEEQFRRNQAELAQTRARIAEGNARRAADLQATRARESTQREADHQGRMKQIIRNGKLWNNPGPTSHSPVRRTTRATSTPAVGSPGETKSPEGNPKVNALLSLAFLGIGGLWVWGKIDGHVALLLLGLLLGLCVGIAILMNLKKIVIGLLKLGVVLLIGYVLFKVIAHS